MQTNIDFTTQQYEVAAFIMFQHNGQVRKYTGDPYWMHPMDVATTFAQYDNTAGGIEIALCHDLLEDTACSSLELFHFLTTMDYSMELAGFICKGVEELTDVYTKEAFPEYNRKKRKQLEAERLATISSVAQSVKYADFLDNTKSIVENDPHFAKIYLKEKQVALSYMDKGNTALRQLCESQLTKNKALI